MSMHEQRNGDLSGSPFRITLEKFIILLILTLIMGWVSSYFYAKAKLQSTLNDLRAQGVPLSVQEWHDNAKANLPEKMNPHTNEIVTFLYSVNNSSISLVENPKTEIFKPDFGIDDQLFNGEWDESIRADVAELLYANAELLLELEKIASYPEPSREEFIIQYLKHYPSDSLVMLHMPDMLTIRGFLSILQLKTKLEYLEGNSGESLETLGTMFKLIGKYDLLHTSLVNGMLSVAYKTLLINSVGDFISNNPAISEEQLSDFKNMLDDKFADYDWAGAYFFEMGQFGVTSEKNLTGEHQSQGQSFIHKIGLSNLGLPYFYLDFTKLLEIMGAHVEVLERHYDNDPLKAQEIFASDVLLEAAWGYIITNISMSNLNRALIPGIEFRALRQLLKLAIEIKRFELIKGKLPDNLDSLVRAKLIEEVPADMFVDAPLKYRKTGKGFVVYSVGEDKRDDGGKVDQANLRVIQHREADLILHFK